MIKHAPRPGQLVAMAAFALSVFGLLLFLWLSFGGAIPLRPESYRFDVAIPEAVTLPVEGDVRMAGVNIGKVKRKELDKRGARTLVELELDDEYAPIPRDTRVVLRDKTLLGEAYLELSPGDRSAEALPDGGRLPDARVLERVQLDEVFQTFDAQTQERLRLVLRELARAGRRGRGRALNDALGNLPGFAGGAERVLEVLERRRGELRRLVHDGGVVLDALGGRRGALSSMIASTGELLETTASRDEALADTVAVLPTFLAETRVTLRRLERFSGDTRPLVRELLPVAGELAPTLRDLGDLSPDLRASFRALEPLIRASRQGLPALQRTVRAARPLARRIHPFLGELNPVLSLLNFYQVRVAGFLSNGGPVFGDFGGRRYQNNVGVIDGRSFEYLDSDRRPEWDRGNTYPQPNFANRTFALGAIESTDCANAIGPRNRFGDVAQDDALDVPLPLKILARRPGCPRAAPSLYDMRYFTLPGRGRAPLRPPPEGTDGALPVTEDERPVPPEP